MPSSARRWGSRFPLIGVAMEGVEGPEVVAEAVDVRDDMEVGARASVRPSRTRATERAWALARFTSFKDSTTASERATSLQHIQRSAGLHFALCPRWASLAPTAHRRNGSSRPRCRQQETIANQTTSEIR